MDSDTLLRPRLESISSFVFLAFILHLLPLIQKSFTRRKLFFLIDEASFRCLKYPFIVPFAPDVQVRRLFISFSHSLLQEWFLLNSLAFALVCETLSLLSIK